MAAAGSTALLLCLSRTPGESMWQLEQSVIVTDACLVIWLWADVLFCTWDKLLAAPVPPPCACCWLVSKAAARTCYCLVCMLGSLSCCGCVVLVWLVGSQSAYGTHAVWMVVSGHITAAFACAADGQMELMIMGWGSTATCNTTSRMALWSP